MVFKYNELKKYVESDLERFIQMGFREKQIFPAILDEYQYGEGYSIAENICIHLISAVKYNEYKLNNESVVNDLMELFNIFEINALKEELGDEYDIFLMN